MVGLLSGLPFPSGWREEARARNWGGRKNGVGVVLALQEDGCGEIPPGISQPNEGLGTVGETMGCAETEAWPKAPQGCQHP